MKPDNYRYEFGYSFPERELWVALSAKDAPASILTVTLMSEDEALDRGEDWEWVQRAGDGMLVNRCDNYYYEGIEEKDDSLGPVNGLTASEILFILGVRGFQQEIAIG